MCRTSKKKKMVLPKFMAITEGQYSDDFIGRGQTPEEALENLREETGEGDLGSLFVLEVTRTGKAKITIEWDKEKN